MHFPFPVLVGDIGGTNARFAVVPEPGTEPHDPRHLVTRDYPSLEAAIAAAIDGRPLRPRSAVVCAAGPVEGRTVHMTNAPWSIDGAAVARAAGLEQGLVLNDFEAQALALPTVRADWVRQIGEVHNTLGGSQLVLGPGTGLGASALIEVGGKHFALASEAGHVDFGPVGAEEGAVWPHIPLAPHGRVSAETVFSGRGMLRLHKARFSARGLVAPGYDEKRLVAQALADHAGEDAATVRLFWRLAARFAGDMTMAFMATGGVTFSGGVLPRLVDLLDPAVFRARFEDKSPFGELLRQVPTRIITTGDAVLAGLGALAAAPDDYAIDWPRRAWV